MDVGIDEKVDQLRREGWCVLERIIPADAIDQVREHVQEAHEKARQDYEAMGGNIGRQTGPNGEPGVCLIAYLPEFAPYLGDERLLGVAQAIFGGHVRIAQIEFKTQVPNREDLDWRGFHSDWPHDLTDRDFAGRVAQPFPDATMQLSVLWMLSPFGPETGGTWVVPRSHRDPAQPTDAPDARRAGRADGPVQADSRGDPGRRPGGQCAGDGQPDLAFDRGKPQPGAEGGDHHALLSVVVERGIWRAQQCDCAEGGLRGPARGGQAALSASGRGGGESVSGLSRYIEQGLFVG